VSSPAQGDQVQTLGGKRKLTIVDAAAQSVGFMGPVFSIAFLVPLLVGITSATGKGAGVAAPLSVALAAVGVLGISWIVAEYARRIQAAGSLYDYVTDGLGQRFGAAAGYLYYTGVVVLGAGLLVLIGGTIHDTLAGEWNFTAIPEVWWDVILLVLVALVMLAGVSVSTRAQFVLALVSITVIFTFFIYVIIKVGSENDVVKSFTPSSAPGGMSGILFGMLYGVLLFTGFETAANLGEETAHPKRDIPRAVLTAVLVVSVFYVVGAYAQVAGFHFDLAAIGKNSGAPLFSLAGPAPGYGADWLRQLVEIVVVLDMLAVLLGISVSGSRGFFAMARDRRLPAFFGKVSGRGTPLVSGLGVLAFFALVVILTKWTTLFELVGPDGKPLGAPEYASMFTWGSTFGGFALVCIYFFLGIGALRGLRDHPKYWAVVIAAVVTLLTTGGAIFGSIYKVPKPGIWATWAALGVFILGFVLTFIFKGHTSASTSFEGLREDEQGPVKI
jgi:amino acid transporter